MKELKELIEKSKMTLLAGVPGIGKDSVYLNLIVNEYKDEKVVIITNPNNSSKIRNKINRIIYADSDAKHEPNNITFIESPIDYDYIKDFLNGVNNIKLVVIDRLPIIGIDNIELLKVIKEISNNIPIIILADLDDEEISDRRLERPNKNDADKLGFNSFLDMTLLVYRKSFYEKYLNSNEIEIIVSRCKIPNYPIQLIYGYNDLYSRIICEPNGGKKEINNNVIGFENIAGYEEVKKELLLIKSWWDNREEISKKGIDIPHGILFYGPIGTGKSMFTREFVNLFPDVTIIKIDGNHSLDKDEVTEKFEYARSLNKFCIILIDEFDFVSRGEERELLTQLDGLGGDNSNIFVIATCNGYDNLNPALTRRGRLDYIIGLGNPNSKERISLFKFYFNKYGIEGDYDFEYLSVITKGENAANIKGIVNEVRLRYGIHPTMQEIEKMVDKINKRDMEYYGDNEDYDDFMTAVHEIGHAIVAMQYKDLFTVYKITLEKNSLAGGLCKVFPTDKQPNSMERMIADIEISMGGYIACKTIYGYMDRGAVEDLERARCLSAALVNSFGYKGFLPLLAHDPKSIPTSPFKKRINERKSERILKKCERNVKKLVKKNKATIIKLSNLLVKNRTLTEKDLN